jgi:drug/metabolite transporter (DMT)-like permease
MKPESGRLSPLPSLLGVLLVSLCWGLGGPLSFAAVQNLSPAGATFGRCAFAFFGLIPFLLLDGPRLLRTLSGKGLALLFASGTLLGVHFYFFIAGVAYASLATAVMIVAVEPVLILVVGVIGFQERLTRPSIFGIFFCVLGVLLISALPRFLSGSDGVAPVASSTRGFGDLCAVLAVLTYAIYYALNRALKPEELRLSLPGGPLRRGFALASIIYFFASLSSGALVLLTENGSRGLSFSMEPGVWGALIAMGLIPTLLGHSLSQILSRITHPVWISLMSPGETLMSLLIGRLFLSQVPGLPEAVGGSLIGIGVLITLRGEFKPTPPGNWVRIQPQDQ